MSGNVPLYRGECLRLSTTTFAVSFVTI
jgi:hypothetical protein